MAKVVKTETKKLTVAEQREILEKKMADLEILEKIEEEITGLANQYKDYFKNSCTNSYPDGKEEEQAKNYNGELLYCWTNDRGWEDTGTMEKAKEAGKTEDDIKPYYRTKYREEVKPVEELDSWSKVRALAYKRLADFFEGLDITEIGEN